MKPTIGRTVHYTSFGTPGGEHLPEPRAAIITAIHSDEDVALVVLNPTGLFFSVDVPFSETPKPGHWNWPPREPVSEPSTGHGAFPNSIPVAARVPGSTTAMKAKGKKKKAAGGAVSNSVQPENIISVTLSSGHDASVDGFVGAALAQMDARSYLR